MSHGTTKKTDALEGIADDKTSSWLTINYKKNTQKSHNFGGFNFYSDAFSFSFPGSKQEIDGKKKKNK